MTTTKDTKVRIWHQYTFLVCQQKLDYCKEFFLTRRGIDENKHLQLKEAGLPCYNMLANYYVVLS